MEACVSPASPSAFHEYSVSLHDRSSNSSPWGCFGSWIILGHCSSRGNLLVPIKWFPSLLKEKFMQNKWWTWSAHPRADGKSVRVLNRHLPCVRVMHVLDVALLQHTWFKWKGRYLNGEPIIWIRCVGAGKRLIRAWHEHQDQGLKNAGLSQWFCFENVCFFIHLHVTSYCAAVIIIDVATWQQMEIRVIINCFQSRISDEDGLKRAHRVSGCSSFVINFWISGLPETYSKPETSLVCFGVFLSCITKILHPLQLFSWVLPNNFAAKLVDYETSPGCPSAASRQTTEIFHLRVEPFPSTSASVKWTVPTPVAVSNGGGETSQKDLLTVFHRPDMAALSSYQCVSLMYKKKKKTGPAGSTCSAASAIKHSRDGD